jgi:uncharacterized protein YndB with AHSA1/START domain
MGNDPPLEMTLPSDRGIALNRIFTAPRPRVFAALTTPDRLKCWLGPPGWELATCTLDLRVGGQYRYVWKNLETGGEMGMGGHFTELAQDVLFTTTERFDQAWYPGEAIVTTRLADADGGTLLTVTIRYEDQAARDMVLGSNMRAGLEASYARLDDLLG